MMPEMTHETLQKYLEHCKSYLIKVLYKNEYFIVSKEKVEAKDKMLAYLESTITVRIDSVISKLLNTKMDEGMKEKINKYLVTPLIKLCESCNNEFCLIKCFLCQKETINHTCAKIEDKGEKLWKNVCLPCASSNKSVSCMKIYEELDKIKMEVKNNE